MCKYFIIVFLLNVFYRGIILTIDWGLCGLWSLFIAYKLYKHQWINAEKNISTLYKLHVDKTFLYSYYIVKKRHVLTKKFVTRFVLIQQKTNQIVPRESRE